VEIEYRKPDEAIAGDPAMSDPTIVVLTDRNDLDDQLFGQFQRCSGVLPQKPFRAEAPR
jgi:type I restriction enzyme R subunit